MKNLAKTDIDMVADGNYKALESLLKNMTVKLYKRNPAELRKVPGSTIDLRITQLFTAPGAPRFSDRPEWGIAAIKLALDPNYTGDRVFAYMLGMTGMLRAAYNYNAEFFMYTELNEQKLYNSARNIEVAVYRGQQAKASHGAPLLLMDGDMSVSSNQSFAQLFGKMIALQDMMADIVAQKNQRTIKAIAHNVASFVFLPI